MRRAIPLAFPAALLIASAAFADDQPQNPAPANPAPQAQPAPPPSPPQLTPKEQADGILGKRVYGASGEDMGLVTDVLVDRDGSPIAAVIDFGGFLGVGNRKIAIDWRLMQFRPGDKSKPITLALQKVQLQAAPEYKPGKAADIVGVSGPVPEPPPPEPPKAPPAPPTPPPADNNGQK